MEEEEVKAEKTREEEAEAKTKVEETVQQMLKEEAKIKIRTKAKAAANKVDNIMLKDKGMKNPMSNVIIVKKYGDYASECKKKQHDMNNRSSANITRENISQDDVLLACNMAETNSEDIWFLDSGCSNHMTGNIALFSALDQSVQSQVTLGTDSKIYVMGKGEVKIFTKKGEKKTIVDVYYVPGMKCNLLSIGQLV